MKALNCSIVLFFLLVNVLVQAETLEGKIVKIADGDTLTLLTSTKDQVKIRLAGIDTPERKQPFGNRVKQALAKLAFQKQALIEAETKDRYGRTVGVVFVDGLNVNHELVKQGMAWVYRKYMNDKALYELESRLRKRSWGFGYKRPHTTLGVA
jgi:micrococcal nuclease